MLGFFVPYFSEYGISPAYWISLLKLSPLVITLPYRSTIKNRIPYTILLCYFALFSFSFSFFFSYHSSIRLVLALLRLFARRRIKDRLLLLQSLSECHVHVRKIRIKILHYFLCKSLSFFRPTLNIFEAK